MATRCALGHGACHTRCCIYAVCAARNDAHFGRASLGMFLALALRDTPRSANTAHSAPLSSLACTKLMPADSHYFTERGSGYIVRR